jgi:hypothetical protein
MLRLPRRFPSTLPLVVLAAAAGCADDGDLFGRRAQLVQYASCDALEQDLERRALEEIMGAMHGWGGDRGAVDDGAEPESDGASDDGGGGREGEDYSGTNNQEAGVDEADLVKTDGERIYLVDGSGLHLFAVPEYGELDPASLTPIEGSPTELLLDAEHGRAAVFSMVYVDQLPEEHPLRAQIATGDERGSMPWRTWGLSKVTILDVRDAEEPKVEREVWLEGWYQTARRTGTTARVILNGHINVPGVDDWWSYAYEDDGSPRAELEIRSILAAKIRAADLVDLIPRAYVRGADGGIEPRSLVGEGCRDFFYPEDSAGRGTTSILSFALDGDAPTFDTETIVSNWATVYASTDRLVLAEQTWDWWWPYREIEPGELFTPSTNLHAFDVSEDGATSYVGSGRIDGTVINQFALDEQDGYLRVAATTRPWRMWSEAEQDPPPPPESHVYVLEEGAEGLDVIGHVGGIAPGEQIFSARFDGDRGFMVTFEQTDPLFTLDLSDPTDPRVVGELDVFGFSTYLHPIEGDRLLAIGVGGDEDGANWETQVSMFDASDFAAPALMDTERLTSEGWGWSEALYEHKAFTYFAPKGLLAVPISSYEMVGTGEETTYTYHAKLELLEVGEDGFARRGAVDHSGFYDDGNWWTSVDIRRSIFMGDFVYALSGRAITVSRLSDLQQVGAAELPIPPAPYWWWPGEGGAEDDGAP